MNLKRYWRPRSLVQLGVLLAFVFSAFMLVQISHINPPSSWNLTPVDLCSSTIYVDENGYLRQVEGYLVEAAPCGYTDADAVAAAEAEDPFDHVGDVTIGGDLTLPSGDVSIGGDLTLTGVVVGTLNAATGRTATLTICASDATALEIAQCDYAADGTADDVEILAAIAALPVGGGSIKLLGHTFEIANKIPLVDYLHLQGEGEEITTVNLAAGFTDNQAFELSLNWTTFLTGVTLSDFTLDGSAPNLGVGLYGRGYQISLYNLHIRNFWKYGINGLFGVDAASAPVDMPWGIHATNVTLENNGRNGAQGSGVDAAMYRSQWIGVTSVANGNSGFWYNPAIDTSFVNSRAEGNGDAGFGGENTDSARVSYIGSSAVDNTGKGWHLTEGVTDLVISGSRSTGNGGDGFWLAGVIRGTVSGSIAVDNGQALGGGAQNGLIVLGGTADSEDVVITGGVFLDTRVGAARTQVHGIHTVDANQLRTVIEGNLTRNNTTTQVRDIGTGSLVRDNQGHITESSGTGSVTSGGVTDVIAHGLLVTPTVADCRIVGAEDPTNDVGTIWLDTFGATNFTVNVEADPGASNWDFGWECTVN